MVRPATPPSPPRAPLLPIGNQQRWWWWWWWCGVFMYLLRASAAPMSARFKWWERIERGRERLIATDSHKARHPLLPLSTLLPYRPSSGYYEGFSTQTHRQTTELTLLLLLLSSGNKGLLPWYSVLAVMFPRIKLILQHLTVSGMTGD